MLFKTLSCTAAVMCLTGTVTAKELKVLAIGNSFSVSVTRNLPFIVNHEKKHKLVFTSAYIGGCSLERHSNNLRKAEKNPQFRPYSITVWDSEKALPGYTVQPVSGNVNELLKKNQYDIITIQQASGFSWKFGTYEPYAAELIAYIRKYQKNAEIVIQQTWSYRCDDKRLEKWNITPAKMYQNLRAAYQKLAEKHQLRVIPTGDAVECFRAATPKKFVPDAPGKIYKEPELPDFSGDVVGSSQWRTNAKTNQRYLFTDPSHLNYQGEYMQSVLWYAFLFNEDATAITYRPENIDADTAELLKNSAQKALQNYVQVK